MDLNLLALLLLCLCRQGLTDPTTAPPETAPSVPEPSTPPPKSQDSLEEKEEQGGCPAHLLGAEAKRAVGGAILKLGLQLLENLKTSSQQPNVVVSPLSVSLALSQLALGAANETEQLLLRSLNADSLPFYHQCLRSLLRHLRSSAVKVATRIYLSPGFRAKQAFIQESLRIYESEPVPLVGVEAVNQWVEKATDGLITDFLSSLPADVVIMLINAVHFKGEWIARFDSSLTAKDRFYIDNENMIYVDMMQEPKYPLSLLMDSELGAQVARFPFKDNTSLLVVMPLSGEVNVSDIVIKLNISDLYARLPSEKTMHVKLPKFKLEYSQELEEALTAMGLGQLFTSPNLSRLADGLLLVSSVRHKSSMELHEEGAEAAAATTVVISRSIPSFSVNQPFFFALLDDVSQTPIFLGVVTNPDPGATAMQSDAPEKTGYFDHKGLDIPMSSIDP
ncbi:hypothetical protein MATL_G00054310 [Megalops atlanticus]|uniref:Serpin domain-containing protein n=1 Tax=Megalops atlanticus TaxID=7932 RepID=A0A9D3QGG7_MEGAT|nr:hypothetical protein MATL_G00054310 [Megalops atlanticus]